MSTFWPLLRDLWLTLRLALNWLDAKRRVIGAYRAWIRAVRSTAYPFDDIVKKIYISGMKYLEQQLIDIRGTGA